MLRWEEYVRGVSRWLAWHCTALQAVCLRFEVRCCASRAATACIVRAKTSAENADAAIAHCTRSFRNGCSAANTSVSAAGDRTQHSYCHEGALLAVLLSPCCASAVKANYLAFCFAPAQGHRNVELLRAEYESAPARSGIFSHRVEQLGHESTVQVSIWCAHSI